LASAIQDPRYAEASRRIERRYAPWKKVRYYARAEGLDADVLWTLVKLGRGAQQRKLPLRGAQGVPLRFAMPEAVQEELMLVDQQLGGRPLSTDDQPLSPRDRERFIVSSLREEAIASSMLEGAATTRRDAKAMLVSGRKPRTRGERMVVNNYEAMEFAREHRNTPLSPELLLQMQEIVTRGTLESDDRCGRFRTESDRVEITDPYGAVLHTPPPASELPARLRELCDFANGKTGDGFIHPVVRACVLHFQIGYDHPFCDGNGRTARAIFYWAMLRAGYWLFEYLAISRLIYEGPSKYAMAYLYSETDEFDVTYFLVYKARVIARARRALSEYIHRKLTEVAEGRRVFEADLRLNPRQRDVVLRMLRNPSLAISIQQHMMRHQVAYATARGDLLNLEAWGYLVRASHGQKRFEFVRGPALRLDAATGA